MEPAQRPIYLSVESIPTSICKDAFTYGGAFLLAWLNHAWLGWGSILLDLFAFGLVLGLCVKLFGKCFKRFASSDELLMWLVSESDMSLAPRPWKKQP